MSNILSYGEILWDILPDKTILGGAPFNFAYRAHSLGNESLFVSSIGTDELGERTLAQVRELGLDSSFLQRNIRYPTGTVNVFFENNHMPDYMINPHVAYDHINITGALYETAKRAECICFGTLIQRERESRQTLQELLKAASNAVKLLDINLRKNCFTRETILFSLQQANILKLNDDEARQLAQILGITFTSFPAFCTKIIQRHRLDYVLVTFGECGAMAQSAFGDEVYVPGNKINLADSLGSGDAFSAAFIHHLLLGHSLQHACEHANALGALVAETHGATAPVPNNAVSDLINGDTARLAHPDFI